MKIKLNLSQLDNVRQAMGAQLKNHAFDTKALEAFKSIETQLLEGIDLTLDQVDGSAGVFTHEGRQIVIYIKDHTHRPDVTKDPSAGNRVHFRDCRTIDGMKRKKRYDRYVATNRRDGLFFVDLDSYSGGEDCEHNLNPCQNCLDELNYVNFKNITYQEKKRVVENFDYEAFLENYSVFFQNRPIHSDRTALPSKYILNWDSISRQTRERNNWKCQDCNVDCSPPTLRKWLHVHHINGVKSDNKSTNLEVLCLLCHAAKPGHNHMKIPAAARNAILIRRTEN